MHKVEITGTKTVLHIPENGYEFTRQQFIDFSGLVYQYITKQIGYREMIVNLTYKICGITRAVIFNKDNDEHNKITENINHLSQLMEAYFIDQEREGENIKVVDSVFMLQKLPVIKHKKAKYYGPADALSDISFAEYLASLNHFFDYSKTANPDALNMLIATLYRPKKWFKNKKEPYDVTTVENRAKIISKLPADVKHAVYLYFASSQNYINTVQDLDVGGGNTVDLSVLFKDSAPETSENSLGMVDVLYSLAETTIFTNIKDVGETNIYDVFVLLVKKHLDAKKQKRNVTNT